MRQTFIPLLALATAISLAACQPSDGETTEGVTPAPAGEQALVEGETDHARMPMGSRTVFSDAEQRMHQGMMAVGAGDTAEVWARKMIAHHQGALDMSEIILDETEDEQIRTIAQRTIEMQRSDIQELERWIAANSASEPDSAG